MTRRHPQMADRTDPYSAWSRLFFKAHAVGQEYELLAQWRDRPLPKGALVHTAAELRERYGIGLWHYDEVNTVFALVPVATYGRGIPAGSPFTLTDAQLAEWKVGGVVSSTNTVDSSKGVAR